MGLFTSNCPSCNAEIGWFLTAPKGFVCNCGTSVSEEEIKQSWTKNYAASLLESVRRTLTRKLPSDLPLFEEEIAVIQSRPFSDEQTIRYCNVILYDSVHNKGRFHVSS